MPVELQIAVGVVAILGFLVSLALAALKFAEWRAKPDLRLDTAWSVGGGELPSLRIAVGNYGRARDSVTLIVFSPADELGAVAFEVIPHVDQLPVMVDPGAFVRLLSRSVPTTPRRSLTVCSAATCVG